MLGFSSFGDADPSHSADSAQAAKTASKTSGINARGIRRKSRDVLQILSADRSGAETRFATVYFGKTGERTSNSLIGIAARRLTFFGRHEPATEVKNQVQFGLARCAGLLSL